MEIFDDFSKGLLPTLDLFDQVSVENDARRLVATPEMAEEVKSAEAFLKNHRLIKTVEGQSSFENAVKMYSLYGSKVVSIDDPERPKIAWTHTTPHSWYGIDWPGDKWGIDTPDNFYRLVAIDGQSRYEIHGKRTHFGPAQQTFVLYSSLPGIGVQNGEGGDVIASLADSEMTFDADGSFIITIAPACEEVGTNHIRTAPNARMLVIRDTLSNWTNQRPSHLRITRVGGPSAAPIRDNAVLAKQAAHYTRQLVEYWTKFYDDYEYSHPENTIPVPYGRAGGWGFLTTGWFNLKDNEAWVITLDPLSAAYFGLQVSDVWGIAAEYVHHTSSLNLAQSRPNIDGSYTFVISARDPGVWNWIDTAGMKIGMFTARWQQLSDKSQIADEETVRGSRVVEIDLLKQYVPAETVWIDSDQRKKQQDDRAASFAFRFEN